MKIAFLLQGRDDPEVAIQMAIALSKQDFVILTLNNEIWRDRARHYFSDNHKVHVNNSTDYALAGDISSVRTWLYQMKDATDKFEFDVCINLTENVLPTTTRQELVNYLQENLADNIISIKRNSQTDAYLASTLKKYYLQTSSEQFSKKKSKRRKTSLMADALYFLGIRRRLKFTVYEGEPWFVLSYRTAQFLAENLSFASGHFIFTWYPERFTIQTMWKELLPHQTALNSCLVSEELDSDDTYFTLYSSLPDNDKIAQSLQVFQPWYKPSQDFVSRASKKKPSKTKKSKSSPK